MQIFPPVGGIRRGLNTIMKKMLYISLILSAFIFTACDKDAHETPKAGHGFLSVALIWEDKLNTTDEIESVHLWIYDKTGTLALEQRYTSPNELALQKYELSAGNVAVAIAVNLGEAVEAQHNATIEDIKYELARQCALYEMMFYGDKTAEAVNGESRGVYVPLHDKPHDDTFIDTDSDINDWEDNNEENGEVLNPAD